MNASAHTLRMKNLKASAGGDGAPAPPVLKIK